VVKADCAIYTRCLLRITVISLTILRVSVCLHIYETVIGYGDATDGGGLVQVIALVSQSVQRITMVAVLAPFGVTGLQMSLRLALLRAVHHFGRLANNNISAYLF